MPRIRLQRFLAQAGIASRRKAEQLIVDGLVSVNGTVVRKLGAIVDPIHDRVIYNGQRIQAEDHVWLLMNKPAGTVSTASDPEGRETVLDLVGRQGVRLYPVGRLDYGTQGVLLLTNDGDLANALMHPKNRIPRTYQVKLKGIIDPDRLDRLREGVKLDTGETVKAQVFILGVTGKHTWIEMTLHQGLNRQVHRMAEAIGYTVLKLVRVAYAGLTAEKLRPGRYRSLSQAEINQLRAAVKLPGETKRKAAKTPGRRSRRKTATKKKIGASKKRTGR